MERRDRTGAYNSDDEEGHADNKEEGGVEELKLPENDEINDYNGQEEDEGEDNYEIARQTEGEGDEEEEDEGLGFGENQYNSDEGENYEDEDYLQHIPHGTSDENLTEDNGEVMEDHLTAMFKEISEENKRLTEANNEYQTRLGEYFRDQKIDDMRERDKSSNHEHRFNRILTQVQEWRNEYTNICSYYEDTIMDMKVKLEEKVAKGNEVRDSFVVFKREIAKEAEYARTGKKMQEKEIDEYEKEELALDKELEVVRLKNIMLKNHLQHLEKTLQEKEKLKDGLHLIDFEQLKIENQTFNEKIEERNEELLKLRKKINNTVQVLTHLKEKLQFIQNENQHLKKKLTDLDSSVTYNRDSLGRQKQQRDVVRVENVGLRQASGLIGLDDLLRDYEQCMNELEASKDKLQGLQDTHARLSIESTQYQSTLKGTKSYGSNFGMNNSGYYGNTTNSNNNNTTSSFNNNNNTTNTTNYYYGGMQKRKTKSLPGSRKASPVPSYSRLPPLTPK